MEPSRSFVYFDGDDVGARIELRLLRNDVDGAATVSRDVVRAIGELADHLRTNLGGTVVFAAGDEVLAVLPRAPEAQQIEQLRHQFLERTELTISCGVGPTPAEAARNLHLAKLLGKDRTAGLSRA